MSNPYSSPISKSPSAGKQVRPPATALMVVSIISIVLLVLGLIFDAIAIATGMVARLEAMNDGPISEYTQITIRIIWGIVLILSSSFVLFGSIKMKNLTDYQTARAASIVAMIPCIGPCCILGIPFGIWAFLTLGKKEVQQLFRS